MRVASIDIGTNCVLLLIAEARGGALVPLLERATITRLGQGVDKNRRLLPEATERTLRCLSEYAGVLGEFAVDRLDAVGTSAMRDAEGGDEFVTRATALLGRAPRVIDGNEEARLTFAGALSGLEVEGEVTVFDIGGGSTEIIVGSSTPGVRRIGTAVSLDIGSVRLFERHLRHDPPTASEMAAVEHDIAEALRDAPTPKSGATLVGVAGTITQLAALELELDVYDSKRVHGRRITFDTIARLAARLRTLSVNERRVLRGMHPDRADVLVAGGAIACAVAQFAGASELLVSDRGVRWGLAEQLLLAHPRE